MTYTPFKMKGHTLPGINQRSEGDTDTPDGRSGSSAFQYKESPAKQTTGKGKIKPPDVSETIRKSKKKHYSKVAADPDVSMDVWKDAIKKYRKVKNPK